MNLVCKVAEATYLLARFSPTHLQGWLRGRLWGRWAARALAIGHAECRQGPGGLSLFGHRSASGLRHEFDGAATSGSDTVIIEAKAYSRSSPTKADVCTFDRKTFDAYVGRRRNGVVAHHWRIMASATPFSDELRQYCYLYGIICVDPEMLPLPLLMQVASHPEADSFLSDQLLSEMVRLGEHAVMSLEARFVPDGPYLRYDVRVLGRGDLDDLLWLQRTLTADLLDVVDKYKSGYYEDLAERTLTLLGIERAGVGLLHVVNTSSSGY